MGLWHQLCIERQLVWPPPALAAPLSGHIIVMWTGWWEGTTSVTTREDHPSLLTSDTHTAGRIAAYSIGSHLFLSPLLALPNGSRASEDSSGRKSLFSCYSSLRGEEPRFDRSEMWGRGSGRRAGSGGLCCVCACRCCSLRVFVCVRVFTPSAGWTRCCGDACGRSSASLRLLISSRPDECEHNW